MYKVARLPQNSKEGILFMLIISIISVNTIAPIIVGMELGFSKANYLETLKIIPFMFDNCDCISEICSRTISR